MMEPNVHGHTMAGTVGGTLLVLLLQISSTEALQTVLLAAIGAAVSFTVSLALRWLTRRLSGIKTKTKNKKNNNG